MNSISPKKVLVSYVITSVVIFFISAAISMSGMISTNIGDASSRMSMELLIIMQLILILSANFILHGVFYYGGFKSSPISRGIGIGAMLGVVYFLVGVFALDLYDINTEMLQLAGAMGGRMIEYATGGIATAVISVTDINRWGLIRAF